MTFKDAKKRLDFFHFFFLQLTRRHIFLFCIKIYFASISSVCSSPLWEKERIREAQKHADPDPQHCRVPYLSHPSLFLKNNKYLIVAAWARGRTGSSPSWRRWILRRWPGADPGSSLCASLGIVLVNLSLGPRDLIAGMSWPHSGLLTCIRPLNSCSMLFYDSFVASHWFFVSKLAIYLSVCRLSHRKRVLSLEETVQHLLHYLLSLLFLYGVNFLPTRDPYPYGTLVYGLIFWFLNRRRVNIELWGPRV